MPESSARAESFRDLGDLSLSSVRAGDAHTIALAGEFDLSSADEVEHELKRVEASDAAVIVIDLHELEFISSIGLRVIVMAHRRNTGRLKIVKGPSRVHRVFEMCDMVRVLSFVDEPPQGDLRPAA